MFYILNQLLLTVPIHARALKRSRPSVPTPHVRILARFTDAETVRSDSTLGTKGIVVSRAGRTNQEQ